MTVFAELVGKVVLAGHGALVLGELLAHLHHSVPPVVGALHNLIQLIKKTIWSINNIIIKVILRQYNVWVSQGKGLE